MSGKSRGISLFGAVNALGSYFALTGGTAIYAFTHIGSLRRPPVMAVLRKQLNFTGLQAVIPVTLAGLALGVGMETQMRSLLGTGSEFNVKIFRVVVLLELGPLLTAFIVLGRSGAAMATELAGMKVRGEIRYLYLKGIDPGAYLLMPRILSCCLAVPVLTIYFQIVAAAAGPTLASLFYEIDLDPYYSALGSSLTLGEVFASLAKSFLFGLVIATIACTRGISVLPEKTWIPQAAERAVMRGFTFVLLVDMAFALLTT